MIGGLMSAGMSLRANQRQPAQVQPRFFPDFAPGRCFDDFSPFHGPARRAPASAIGAFQQEQAPAPVHDQRRRADHQDRRVTDVLAQALDGVHA